MPRKTPLLVIAAIVGGVLALMLGFLVGSILLQPQGHVQTQCPPECGVPPPTSPPLRAPRTYQSSELGYSVVYDAKHNGQPSRQDATGASWTADQYEFYAVNGERSSGRGAEQIATELIQRNFSGAVLAFSIPGAELGYNPGVGQVYDTNVRTPSGTSVRMRIVVMVAVKAGIAVEQVAVGQYDDSRNGHPIPALTLIVLALRELDNSVTWPGEQPR